ncbi:MAG TPA: sigma-E processing peptidase SpoIIGA, partial [Mobilitalea sp.]|nr:sigma-E processing peptidase SpoIIGA [Mobilitalea sp.]
MYLEVYPDIVFILNFIIDFILLFLLKKVNRKNSSFLRMSGAAAIGAVVAVILSIFPYMNVILRFLTMNAAGAVLMILIAFGRMKKVDLLKQVITLYLITYFVGGLMNSIYYHTNFGIYLLNLGNGTVFSNISWKFVLLVILLIVPTVLIILWLFRWYRSNAPQTYDVELIFEDRSVQTKGLMDTGNCLYDPIYKKPVMVIENSLMEKLLTPEFRQDMEKAKLYIEGNSTGKDQLSLNNEHMLRLRFVPYQSVGKAGMMLGLLLD